MSKSPRQNKKIEMKTVTLEQKTMNGNKFQTMNLK